MSPALRQCKQAIKLLTNIIGSQTRVITFLIESFLSWPISFRKSSEGGNSRKRSIYFIEFEPCHKELAKLGKVTLILKVGGRNL
jgi:hypothetical protein